MPRVQLISSKTRAAKREFYGGIKMTYTEYKATTLEGKRKEALEAARQEEINAKQIRLEQQQNQKEKLDTVQEKQDTIQKKEDVKQAKLGLKAQINQYLEARAENKQKKEKLKLEKLERLERLEQQKAIVQEKKLRLQSQQLRVKGLRKQRFQRSFTGKLLAKTEQIITGKVQRQRQQEYGRKKPTPLGSGAGMRNSNLAQVSDKENMKDILFDSDKEVQDKDFKKFKLF